MENDDEKKSKLRIITFDDINKNQGKQDKPKSAKTIDVKKLDEIITSILNEQEKLNSFWSSVMLNIENNAKVTVQNSIGINAISDIAGTLLTIVTDKLNIGREEFRKYYKKANNEDISEAFLTDLFGEQTHEK